MKHLSAVEEHSQNTRAAWLQLDLTDTRRFTRDEYAYLEGLRRRVNEDIQLLWRLYP